MSRKPAKARPRKRKRAPKVAIDVIVESGRWKTLPRASAIVRKAITTAAQAVSTPRAELAIVLTDDSAIRALNRDWRGFDKPTNVLSFPAQAGHAAAHHLGDIVIAHQTVAREARHEGKPLRHHLAHLAVHGFLHLVGHDHDNDRDARKMERLEVEILVRLGVPDPYAEPAARA